MTYKIETPNKLYKGITEGVPFSQGVGQTDDKNVRNVLVNDYGYEDITEDLEDLGTTLETTEPESEETVEDITEDQGLSALTVSELKELAKDKGLTHYSKLNHSELIDLIEKAATKQ